MPDPKRSDWIVDENPSEFVAWDHLAFEPINLNKAGVAFIKPGWKLNVFLTIFEKIQTTKYTKGTPPEKNMFSFGHCPNEGGGGPCPN